MERDNKAFFSNAYNWQTQLVLNARDFFDRTNKNTTSTTIAESPWFDHHNIRSGCPRHHRTLPNILINNIPSRRHRVSNITPLIMNVVAAALKMTLKIPSRLTLIQSFTQNWLARESNNRGDIQRFFLFLLIASFFEGFRKHEMRAPKY